MGKNKISRALGSVRNKSSSARGANEEKDQDSQQVPEESTVKQVSNGEEDQSIKSEIPTQQESNVNENQGLKSELSFHQEPNDPGEISRWSTETSDRVVAEDGKYKITDKDIIGSVTRHVSKFLHKLKPTSADNDSNMAPSSLTAFKKDNEDVELANGVGDKLMDVYPDRNPGESSFPNLKPSVVSPEGEELYNNLRSRIINAIFIDNFRNGHFKNLVNPDASIAHTTLHLHISSGLSEEQMLILQKFSRAWCKAIGASAVPDVIDRDWLEKKGVLYEADRVVEMFEKERADPLPYPMPEELKYHDPRTLRRMAAEAEAAKAAGPSTAGASSEETNPAEDDDNVHPLLKISVTKAGVLAKLAEYDAANSADRVLRHAWEELTKFKGEFSKKNFDKLSEETSGLIYSYVQSVMDANNIPMPLGVAFKETIARLEAVQLAPKPDAKSTVVSTVYDEDAPKDNKSDKSKYKGNKTKIDSKGKGKENDPHMGPDDSASPGAGTGGPSSAIDA